MERTIDVMNMIRLPRLNADRAVVLGEQLLTAAAAEQSRLQASGEVLPSLIERCRARLASSVGELKALVAPRETEENSQTRAADSTVDRSWSRVSDWVSALADTPVAILPEAEKMDALRTLIFNEGLSFLTLSYKEEWSQSEARLTAIDEQGFAPVIESLGGGPLLTALRAAHEAYGVALNITTPMVENDDPKIRPSLVTLQTTMKSYVVKVAAWADPEDPGSEALADNLLLPLRKWKDTTASHSDADAQETPTLAASVG